MEREKRMPRISFLIYLFVTVATCGCYAPLKSPGIPAASLDDSFRYAEKAREVELNFATLTGYAPTEYILGADDIVNIRVSEVTPFAGLENSEQASPNRGVSTQKSDLDCRISAEGTVLLPLIGTIKIGGFSVEKARQEIVKMFAAKFLDNPKVSVSLVERSSVGVMVLGGVNAPGYYKLPKYENDIAHAIASAGGIQLGQTEIQVHRRASNSFLQTPAAQVVDPALVDPGLPMHAAPQLSILRIPLRCHYPPNVSPQDAVLFDSDVVVVKKSPDKTFYVVGQLSGNNQVRFTVGNDNRDLGNGFLLPPDRDVDVVTAVAMAGYIDPIDSPTTVTVHRTGSDGNPLLIRVDLIAARFDRSENIMVLPGDIIYLNPDPAWWLRRTLDRVLPTIITAPYTELMQKLLNPGRLN